MGADMAKHKLNELLIFNHKDRFTVADALIGVSVFGEVGAGKTKSDGDPKVQRKKKPPSTKPKKK